MTKSSDPRSFVFSDNLSGASLDYKSDLSNGMIWYGNANQSRPGVPFIQRDRYLGVLGSLQFMDGFKPTLFGVWRNWVGELYQFENGGTRGNSDYFWGGATIDITVLDPLTFQYTYIHNWGKFHGDGEEHTDKLKAKLQDAKIMFNWQAPQMTFSLEGLETSGAKGSQNASGQYYIGKRKNFMSPIGAAYLMTIATSDGADDAPGSPKQSTVANLNLPEGLRMAIFTTSANMTKRATLFARAGMIKTQANANITESSDYGKEFDLGGVYQLTPSTIFQIDYGDFIQVDFFKRKILLS
jgi:hypothetical protein